MSWPSGAKTDMSYGYSQRLIEANKKADGKSLGVALGRVCIKQNISVSELADKLGVTRATIYNWFWGLRTPDRKRSAEIERLLAKLKRT